MNTFLPFMSFHKSAHVLDVKRHNKQRTEVLEILVILNGEQPEWMSDEWYSRCLRHEDHPAVLMWDNYTPALVEYGCIMCSVWEEKGYTDRIKSRILEFCWGDEVVRPPWITLEFCKHMRSNLLRKYRRHYSKFFEPDLPDDLPYLWPVGRA